MQWYQIVYLCKLLSWLFCCKGYNFGVCGYAPFLTIQTMKENMMHLDTFQVLALL